MCGDLPRGPRCVDFMRGHQEVAVLLEKGCRGQGVGSQGWADGCWTGGRPGGSDGEMGQGQGWV